MTRYAIVFLLFAYGIALENAHAQYKDEGDASVPLEYYYIERQGPSLFRKILSRFTVSLGTGYGATTFKHKLDGFGIVQNIDSMPKIFIPPNPSSGFSNWFNTLTPSGNGVTGGSFLVDSDTTEIGFKNPSWGIPLKASIHVAFDRYRVGGGFSFDYINLGTFQPLSYQGEINNFSPDFGSFFLKKYFVLLGGEVYRYNEYILAIDANIGGYSLGSKFDKAVIKKGMFINIGPVVEREMSEYFRLFVRPSLEFKSYKLNLPESGLAVTHRLNAFYLTVGATYRIPELRRCFLKTCKAQINHAHGNREYRSRVHPIHKKQNPHYGENYPTLIKYKGKNKKKLNPY